MKLQKNGKMVSKGLSVDAKRRALTTAVWLTPVVSAVTLPSHAQTSQEASFVAGNYQINFVGGGGSNTVDCTGTNTGSTLTIGIRDFEALISSDGSISSDETAEIFGIPTLENVIDASGILNFNQSFPFTDPVLGECTTELTITGNIIGSALSGILMIEASCDGCLAMMEAEFTGTLM